MAHQRREAKGTSTSGPSAPSDGATALAGSCCRADDESTEHEEEVRTVDASIALLVTVVWLVIAGALLQAPDALDDGWGRVHRLPAPTQATLWVVFLPWMSALWLWHRRLPFAVRALLVLVLAVATIAPTVLLLA